MELDTVYRLDFLCIAYAKLIGIEVFFAFDGFRYAFTNHVIWREKSVGESFMYCLIKQPITMLVMIPPSK